jgi:CRP-like cAMP-binding protein
VREDSGSGPAGPGEPSGEAGEVTEVPVIAGIVRWERPTARSFWNSLDDTERAALAAAGAEELFRAGSVLCREGDDASQVMIIDSGWVKVSVAAGAGEKILAVRGQGDLVGERAALTTQVRSATVIALDEVTAMVVPAERFADFLRGHPRAARVLERQVVERREEDRARLFAGEPAGAERRLAWLLLDLAQRRGSYRQGPPAQFTLPMSHQELADWAGTTADAVGRLLRAWRERGIVVRGDRPRRLTIADLDKLAGFCDVPRPEAQANSEPRAAVPPEHAVPRGVVAARPAAGGAAGLWTSAWHEPLNCSILITDVAGYGDPERNDGDRDVIRAGMYGILGSAFDAAGMPWADCYREDRGDGVVVVMPPMAGPGSSSTASMPRAGAGCWCSTAPTPRRCSPVPTRCPRPTAPAGCGRTRPGW